MSLKDYYEKAKSLQALSNKSAGEIGEEVESAAYHTEDIIREERFIPRVNFKYPKNFARYGSAEEYYAQSLRRIYEDYPYDGSLRERLEWENKSTYLDLHVFENEYPRTNGYINMSAGEWGNVSAKKEGYGLPADVEYIFLKGGPHPNPDGMSPYSTQLTGANYYETALNRTNNLQFDLLSKGATVEFWMKKDAFDLTKTEKEVIFDLWNGIERIQATAVDAIDTTGVVADGGDCTITITIPAANGGDTTGGAGAITILLDASETTGTPAAADQIGIGILGESDSSTATLIKRAINNTSNSRIIPASAGSRGTAGVSGITATEGSSNTQLTLTMDAAGPDGNIAGALANVTGPTIVDVTDFTGGVDEQGRFRLELTGASGADCLRATVLSGGHGFEMQSVADSTLTSEAIADGTWHHYALTMMSASNGVLTNFYLDGNLNRSQVLGSSMDLNEVTGALRANIGALISSPVSSSAAQYSGKLSASLDEFRYWKTERSGKEIGRHWFTQVGGGTNDDPEPFKTTLDKVNTDLGVYYKFNEGITGVAATDSVLLDYSGRISNGSWTGYSSASRATGSAIVLSNAASKEFKDPIIYAFHPEVSALATRMRLTGSSYDVTNNAAIYNSIPAWITEEDNEGQRQLKQLVQIMSSYFDTLQLQVESLPSLGNINYASGSHKPLPFAGRLVSSAGLAVPELFIDADIIEKLADRSEDRIYEKSLADIKNTIYQNIYNNLVYIYKTKGTEKSFRNLIRCFGIDDELVKLNMYGDGIEYEVRENRRTVSVVDKFVDFNTPDNTTATVYQSQGSDTTNTKGYLPQTSASATGFAQTLEADILFPLKPDEHASFYYNTNTVSASLFGVHTVHNNENYTTWATSPADSANFQVYAVRDEQTSDSVRFVLTGTAGTCVPWSMASDLYEEVYNNTYWNLAVRIKPLNYPQAGQVLGAPTSADINNYTIELHGIQLGAGTVHNEFNLAATVEGAPGGFVTGSKRAFIGAHRTNFTGSVLEASDVKVNACRYWYDYLEDDVLVGHAYDTQNYGSLYPARYAFPFDASASFGEVLQSDTLVFNWEFAENTGSNASGQFAVADESSGSIDTAARFDALGDILGYQYPAQGYGFLESSTKVVDKDHVISSKLQLPENVHSSDMITVLGAQEQQVFTRDSRPVNYFFAFEKSMAQALSVEMINYFATLKDIHNLIGAPVNRYRPEYKGLKVLRQRFFERVSNSEIDFEKFYEFYKWFDSSLTMMLQQLVPASADFAENVRTVIESHMLERSKYQHKIQNVKQQVADPEGTLQGNSTQMPQGGSPEDNPAGIGFFSANAATRRQIGTSQPINFKNWKFIHAPVPPPPPDPKSLLFDGTDEYVDIGAAGTWDTLIGLAGASAKAFSLSLWLKPAVWPTGNAPGIITFGNLDRGLVCNSGTGPNNTRLFAKLDTGGSLGTIATAGALTQDVWQHVVVTYAGASGGALKIYVDASETSYDVQTTGAPEAIVTNNGVIGSSTPSGVKLPGNMCDVAVWDKELSSAEVTEIYGSGKRVNLKKVSTTPNLLSWWMMGADPLDTYDGTIYDQVVGGRNGTPTNFDSAADIEEDSPVFAAAYYGSITNENSIWWQSEAARNTTALVEDTPSADPGLLKNKQAMLENVKSTNQRAQQAPYKFGAEGNSTLGGVGFGINKKTDFVFVATTPFGSVRNGAAENIMVGFRREVEELMNTKDVYHPAFKQRLGFQLNPDINRDNSDLHKGNGNLLAPFSIYSSSVTTGQNLQVIQNYAPDIEITNLHHDIVHDSDTPLQGPFTEKFVGGRQYRHTELNEGSDSARYRAEGWKIKFDKVLSKDGADFETPMIGIVPPNYDGGAAEGFDKDVPTAHRLRNVGAKRPINIQNIKMTTSSVGTNLPGTLAHGKIGNYQKNYEVVQTSGRTQNDFYFNDQSYDFARYPETLSTRGRFPLTPQVGKSVHFDGNNDYIDAGVAGGSDWEAAVGGAGAAAKPVSFSMWLNADSLPSGYWIFKLGDTSTPTYSMQINSSKLRFVVGSSGTDPYVFSSTISAGTWYHVVVTLAAGTGNKPNMYINGALDNGTLGSATSDNIAIADILRIGDAALCYDGYICDFAVWGKELSAAEASTIYSAGGRINLRHIGSDSRTGGLNPTPNGLIAWYPLGDDSRDANDGTFHDQMGFANGTANNFSEPTNADSGISPEFPPYSAYGSLIENPRGNLDYELPNRTGANSNQSVIVNRFSAGGAGYEVNSPGYMDPAHEEMSVYNASPYRSPRTLNFGNTGSLGQVYGELSGTIQVRDQIGRPRGLRQLSRLHSGRFGADGVFGEVVPQTYVTVPSYHKTNRNAKVVMKEISGHAAKFDSPYESGVGYALGTVASGAIGGAAYGSTLYNAYMNFTPNPVSNWSMATWLYIDANSPNMPPSGDVSSTPSLGRHNVFAVTVDNGQEKTSLYYNQSDDKMVWHYSGSENGLIECAGAAPLNRWFHIALVRKQGLNNSTIDEKFLRMYINGVEDWQLRITGSGTGILQVPLQVNSQLSLGASGDGGTPLRTFNATSSYPWIGSMSEMVWYVHRSLTTTPIQSLYNGGYTFDLFDSSMVKQASTETVRQEYNELGLPHPSTSGSYPTDLLTNLVAYYRFHQFSGSQIGGTDTSYGYSDNPARHDGADAWNTLGVLNAIQKWFTGSYPTYPVKETRNATMPLSSVYLNGNVKFESTNSPKYVQRSIQYDNLFVQHPIPRSVQQYSWVTSSLQSHPAYRPIPAQDTFYDLQAPSCIKATSLEGIATHGDAFSRGPRIQRVNTTRWGRPTPVTGSDRLMFFGREPLHVGLNTMIVDPVDTSLHIQGATVVEPPTGDPTPEWPATLTPRRLGGPQTVPTNYEATPVISSRDGQHFNNVWGTTYFGHIYEWDALIGTGSTNANQMSWTWWMRRDGPGKNAYNYNTVHQYSTPAHWPRIFNFGNSNMYGSVRAQPGTFFTTVDDDGYLSLYASNFSTATGSWVVCDETGGSTIENGKWYHVVMTYDGSSASNNPIFYVNGRKYTVSGSAIGGSGGNIACRTRPTGSYVGLSSNFTDMTVGNSSYYAGSGLGTVQGTWDGMFADLAVWNTILNDSQAAALYNNGAATNIKQLLPEDLVAWYRFSPGAGDRADTPYNHAIPTAYSQSNAGAIALGEIPMLTSTFPTSGSLMPVRNTAPDLKTFESDYATSFNTLNLGRNGPYGHPTWKQIRTGEHKVARQLRKENKIGVLIPPAPAKSRRGLQQGKQANKFVDYTEMPVVYDTAKPIEFVFEDRAGGNKDNDLRLKVSYQNNMDYFTNQGLNNRLSLGERIRPDVGNAFNAAADYLFDSNLSAVVKYGQKIYPAATNTGQKRIRVREAYNFDDVWNEVRKYRSIQIPPKPNSQGFYDPGESVWPLDAPMALTHSPDNPAQQASYPPGGLRGLVVQGGGIMPGGQTADSIEPAGYMGSQAGELMNTYARFGLYSQKGVSSITASLAYTMPIRNGVLSTGSVGHLVQPGGTSRPARGTGLLFGYQSWTAHESASMPYKPYEGYMENVQKLGKNMSIIPEFRISDHMAKYILDENGNFQADVKNLFSVTGAIQADSTNEDFYKVYSTSDFMKYFKVVDQQLANKTTAAGAQLKRHAIELSCDALMQFLPYKGFYPAERTVELGRLLSQSLGPIASYPFNDGNWNGAQKITKRILLEPLMAPGILFNTIKSGIACSSLVLVGGNGLGLTASVDSATTASFFGVPGINDPGVAGYRESNLDGTGYFHLSALSATGVSSAGKWPFYNLRIVSRGAQDLYGTNFYGQPIPFEAIRDPDTYLSINAINKHGDEESVKRRARKFLYDTGLGSSSLGLTADGSTPRILYKGNSRSPLYKLGIDNFLCETVNFFQQPLKSFVSKPEEEFLAVKKDKYYGMRIKLARTNLSASESGFPLERTFGMYSRDSAFGPPVQLRGSQVGVPGGTTYQEPGISNDRISYEPWLPPHWYGSCEANVIFKAPYSGKVTLDEILGNKVTEFTKVSADAAAVGTTGIIGGDEKFSAWLFQDYAPGYDVVRPQVTSSVDISEKLLVVPPDTNTQQARWLIQTKFEAPMLNFFGVPASASAVQGLGLGSDAGHGLNTNSPFYTFSPGSLLNSAPKVRGMWHQYGKTLSGSEGIHLSIENLPTQYSSSTYGGTIDVNPLTEIVGLTPSKKRIGDFADEKTVEEAIVCVPFITVRGNREFFNVEMRSQEYVTQLALLNKYVFPPNMDFLKNHKEVSPFAFYAFEFNMQFTQKDLMDIWQNCAPTKGSAFQKSNVTIKIRSLVDKMLENKEELQWMVFKVKRKAEKDYSVYTKKGLTEGLPIVQESLDSPYSYNWPYDYFSFVELVKIDESVTYATDDIIPEDEEEDVMMPDLREFIPAPRSLPRVIAPPSALLREVEEGIPTRVIKPETGK